MSRLVKTYNYKTSKQPRVIRNLALCHGNYTIDVSPTSPICVSNHGKDTHKNLKVFLPPELFCFSANAVCPYSNFIPKPFK